MEVKVEIDWHISMMLVRKAWVETFGDIFRKVKSTLLIWLMDDGNIFFFFTGWQS